MLECPKCQNRLNSVKDTWNQTVKGYVLCRECNKIYKIDAKLVG